MVIIIVMENTICLITDINYYSLDDFDNAREETIRYFETRSNLQYIVNMYYYRNRKIEDMFDDIDVLENVSSTSVRNYMKARNFFYDCLIVFTGNPSEDNVKCIQTAIPCINDNVKDSYIVSPCFGHRNTTVLSNTDDLNCEIEIRIDIQNSLDKADVDFLRILLIDNISEQIVKEFHETPYFESEVVHKCNYSFLRINTCVFNTYIEKYIYIILKNMMLLKMGVSQERIDITKLILKNNAEIKDSSLNSNVFLGRKFLYDKDCPYYSNNNYIKDNELVIENINKKELKDICKQLFKKDNICMFYENNDEFQDSHELQNKILKMWKSIS